MDLHTCTLKWKYGITRKDIIKNKYIRENLLVILIEEKIKEKVI